MNTLHRTAGFSLVEVMCAILILGIGLAGLTEGMTAALRSSRESERQTAAALIAAGQIETLRAEGWIVDGVTESSDENGRARYRWRQSVSSTAIDGLHEVEVVVEEVASGKSVYVLRTLLFEPPLSSPLDESVGRRESARKREGRRR